MFTTNQFPAAPVLVSRTNLAASLRSGGNTSLDLPEGVRPGSPDDPDTGRYGYAEAVISTSGSANAATGMDGDDAISSRSRWPRRCGLGVDPLKVLCLSTGMIGTRLPVDRVKAGIDAVAGDARDDRRRAAGGGRGAAHDRLGDQGRDHVVRDARMPTASGPCTCGCPAWPRASG